MRCLGLCQIASFAVPVALAVRDHGRIFAAGGREADLFGLHRLCVPSLEQIGRFVPFRIGAVAQRVPPGLDDTGNAAAGSARRDLESEGFIVGVFLAKGACLVTLVAWRSDRGKKPDSADPGPVAANGANEPSSSQPGSALGTK